MSNGSGFVSHHCRVSSHLHLEKQQTYPQSQLLSLATQRLTSSPRSPQSSSAYFLRYCFSYSDHGPERQQIHEESEKVKLIHANQHTDTGNFKLHNKKWRLVSLKTKLQAKSSYLAAHVDWYAHNDDWDGDACYQGDDYWRTEQHAHLPHNLAGLRPWLLPPERASWGAERHNSGTVKTMSGMEASMTSYDGKASELVRIATQNLCTCKLLTSPDCSDIFFLFPGVSRRAERCILVWPGGLLQEHLPKLLTVSLRLPSHPKESHQSGKLVQGLVLLVTNNTPWPQVRVV